MSEGRCACLQFCVRTGVCTVRAEFFFTAIIAAFVGFTYIGVGDAQMIADNRETLQGRAKVDMGGKSATMMYAFPFTLCRRAVVATMDNAANNLDYFNTHHWLSNRQNVIVLKLTSQAWV